MSEFEETLEELNNCVCDDSDPLYGGAILSSDGLHVILCAEDVKTIRLTLLIADRLMQEPSDGMLKAIGEEWKHENLFRLYDAMRDQLLKEVDEDLKGLEHE